MEVEDFLYLWLRQVISFTGLDFDEYMLEKIAPKVTGMKNITWYKADVINDEWGKGYDIVILAANFLMNIVSDMDYERAQELLVEKSAKALLPGGHIFIDYGYTQFPEAWFNNPNDKLIWQGTDSNGKEITQDIPSKKYFVTPKKVHKWLANAGFIVENEYGDYNYHPISETTNHAMIWARKL